ncbi:hypothetical protein CB1_000714002 [Camelus ferus]|nr:hypothetical protein CB1_000714002 [Camelus ferus]
MKKSHMGNLHRWRENFKRIMKLSPTLPLECTWLGFIFNKLLQAMGSESHDRYIHVHQECAVYEVPDSVWHGHGHHFREHLDKLFAKGIGMLDIALNEAFSILSDFNHTGQGSICSQAIMLITDGAVDTYDTIFAKYNWPDRKTALKVNSKDVGKVDLEENRRNVSESNQEQIMEQNRPIWPLCERKLSVGAICSTMTKVTAGILSRVPQQLGTVLPGDFATALRRHTNSVTCIISKGAYFGVWLISCHSRVVAVSSLERRGELIPSVTFLDLIIDIQYVVLTKSSENEQVRIFTYLIGREAAFADNLKWMACANKGFFTQISTLADVQENVMEYLHVLSRPKVIDQEHDVVWTEAYIDSTFALVSLVGKIGDKS